jgi:hypothetical protein
MYAYEKAVYLDELSDGAIAAIVEHQPKKMSPLSFVPILVLGGAYERADTNGSAFGGSRDTATSSTSLRRLATRLRERMLLWTTRNL